MYRAVGLGASYNIGLNTPFGRVGSTIDIPVEQAARDAVNAAWPPLQQKLEAEAPRLIGQVWPGLQQKLQAEVPHLIDQLKPALEAEAPKLIKSLMPTLQAEVPKMLSKAQPLIDAERKAFTRDIQHALVGVGAAICGVVLLSALWIRH
jgi:hypothetical protein